MGARALSWSILSALLVLSVGCSGDSGADYSVSNIRIRGVAHRHGFTTVRVTFSISNEGSARPVRCHEVVTSASGAVVASGYAPFNFSGGARGWSSDLALQPGGRPVHAAVTCMLDIHR